MANAALDLGQAFMFKEIRLEGITSFLSQNHDCSRTAVETRTKNSDPGFVFFSQTRHIREMEISF